MPTNIHTDNRIFTNIILMADKVKMHRNCMLLPEDIVSKSSQRNIRSANTCDPVLKLLNKEITSDIQKHKQTYGRSIYTLTGTTCTIHTFYVVYPIEHLQPHPSHPATK